MRDRAPVALVSLVLALVMSHASPGGAEPPPTPTARPRTAKKLGGGSFGTPPAPTPTPGAASAGSLADVVRQTQEETQATGEKRSRGIVITNESLRNPAATPSSTSVTITGKAGSKPVVKGPAKPTPAPATLPEYRDASGRTEADWKALAAAAREKADRTSAELAAAQAEVRRLENDFYAWSDGNYRERVIRPAWDQAKEKLKLIETEAEKSRAAMDELEEEARKSGTPPGWLR